MKPQTTSPPITDLMPSDTPGYMFQAWVDCMAWAIGKAEIVAAFRAETGNQWRPARNGLEQMIDTATGSDRQFIVAFIEWANVNVWGTMDGGDVQEASSPVAATPDGQTPESERHE